MPASIIASMSVRRIGLVHPPPAAFPSGGDLYDRELLRAARSHGFALHGLPWRDGALPTGQWDLLVWDGLLMDRLARVADERVALLLHYLPTLDPALDARDRAALQATEDHALAQADLVIATGRRVADVVRTRRPDMPVCLCEPGVADAFGRRRSASDDEAVGVDRPANSPPTLLTVAHLLPAKGHGPLLELLGQVRDLAWHWHVVGDVDRLPGLALELRQRAAALGLASRITWHGAIGQESVAALMAGSDLFVFPSSFEAYGMAIAEAVAAGLPVLANRVGAAAQLVRHGSTGYLANAGDWDGFGRHLRELLGDAALRAAFREKLHEMPVRGWDEAFADFRAACEMDEHGEV